LTTDHEENTGRSSPKVSAGRLLVFASLFAAGIVVFALLPRWAADPVVTTDPALARPSSPPSPTSSSAPAESIALASGTPPPTNEATTGEPIPAPEKPGSVAVAASPAAAPPVGAFDAAMTEGLAAVERGAAAEARAAFERAEALRPGTTAVRDGLARADSAQRAEALAGHRQRAEAAERLEDWPTALREYEAALRVEPAVRFAVEGGARASLRAQIASRLDGYLRRPDRLSSEEVAAEAEVALDRASDMTPAGPKLRHQIEELRAQLAAARTPVPVRLLSYERTEVSVLRVGPMGRFREKALELKPGSYVVVGTRRGYRDTRHTLVVPPGQSPEPLVVRCHEVL
jgi:hypothetical protein